MVRSLFISINLLLWSSRISTTKFDYYVHNRAANGSVTNFSYDPANPNSPDNWDDFAPECGGSSQSPINIKSKKAKRISKKSGELKGSKWCETPDSITFDNNGHTVRVIFAYPDQNVPNVIVNGAVYEMTQIHYHFGLNRKSGSEHYINGIAYAMEGHAVFYNLKYGTLNRALKYPDGVTVISRLYDEDDFLTVININFDFLEYVRNPGDSFTIKDPLDLFTIEDIMGPLNLPYYMYHGSLTTPGCNEVVTWIVAANPLRISSVNVFQFRQLGGNDGLMAPNCRPLQKINGRTIYYHKGGHSTVPIKFLLSE